MVRTDISFHRCTPLALTNLQQWEQQQGTAIDTPTTYLQLTTKP